MDESQISRLPRELRLIIWEYALTTEFSMDLRAEISGWRDRRSPTVKLLLERNHLWNEDRHSDGASVSEIEEDSDASSSINEDSGVDSGSDSDIGFICGNALYSRYTQSSSEDSSNENSDNGISGANPLALTSTCRQVRVEALPVFYAVNGICLEHNEEVYSAFPTLQIMLLTHWLRHIPRAQDGLFRHITISVPDQLYRPDKAMLPQALAQTIYERYVEFASCFDTSRTELSLDLGHCAEFNPVRTWSSFTVRRVRTKFIMTPWTGLRQQVEAFVTESKGRFERVKAKVTRWQRAAKSVERVQKPLVGSEDDARYIYGVLRHLVGIVEEVEGHTK